MSQGEGAQWANSNRVDALARKVDHIKTELGEEIAALESENEQLRQRVAALEDELEAIGADEVDASTPDSRALKLRQWLYQEANQADDETATADVNTVRGVLGGCHRTQRYEAMRRAAGGDELAESGSSALSAVPGVAFQQFDANDDRNTRVVMDLTDLTEKQGRSILTTGGGSEGAAE